MYGYGAASGSILFQLIYCDLWLISCAFSGSCLLWVSQNFSTTELMNYTPINTTPTVTTLAITLVLVVIVSGIFSSV